jgi:hypothetical protein
MPHVFSPFFVFNSQQKAAAGSYVGEPVMILTLPASQSLFTEAQESLPETGGSASEYVQKQNA